MVLIVRVTGTDVVVDVKVTVAGLKLQLLSGGRLKQSDAHSVADPVKSSCEVNVSGVEPDCPGLATVMVVGLAVIVNDGFPTVSVRVADDGK